MTELIALRPKSYAYRKLDNKDDKKCKRIKKCVVKKTLDFDDSKNCLLDVKSKSIYRSQLTFKNNKHEIHTVKVNKVALNREDDKQIVKKDGILSMLELLTRGYITKLLLKRCERREKTVRIICTLTKNFSTGTRSSCVQ